MFATCQALGEVSTYLDYPSSFAFPNTDMNKVFLPWGFPGSSDGKESVCNAEDSGLIPGLGRSPGGGNVYPLQCSCLENSMDRGAWWATVHEVTKSWTQLSDSHTHTLFTTI